MASHIPTSPPSTPGSRRASAPNNEQFMKLKESSQIPLPPSPQSLKQESLRSPPRRKAVNQVNSLQQRPGPPSTTQLPPRIPRPFSPFPQPLPSDLIDRRKTPDRRWKAPTVSWPFYRPMSPFDDASIASSRPFSPISSIELSSPVSRTSMLSPLPCSRLPSPVDRQSQESPFEPRHTISQLETIRPLSPLLGENCSTRSLGNVHSGSPSRSIFATPTPAPAPVPNNTPISPTPKTETRESATSNAPIDTPHSFLPADVPSSISQTGIARIARSYSARTISLSTTQAGDADMPPLKRFPPCASSVSVGRGSRFTEQFNVSGELMYASTVNLVGSRTNLVAGGFADREGEGSEERRCSERDGSGDEERKESEEKEVDVDVEVKKKEKKKKGWKGSLRKGAKWMSCCTRRRPDEDLEG